VHFDLVEGIKQVWKAAGVGFPAKFFVRLYYNLHSISRHFFLDMVDAALWVYCDFIGEPWYQKRKSLSAIHVFSNILLKLSTYCHSKTQIYALYTYTDLDTEYFSLPWPQLALLSPRSCVLSSSVLVMRPVHPIAGFFIDTINAALFASYRLTLLAPKLYLPAKSIIL
jgi:hypothetical protein